LGVISGDYLYIFQSATDNTPLNYYYIYHSNAEYVG